MGKWLTCLPDSCFHNCKRAFITVNSHLHNCKHCGQLQYVRAAETFNVSHRSDEKFAHVLAPTHACTIANDSVNYSMYVPQRA
jgi:hypothetical protein